MLALALAVVLLLIAPSTAVAAVSVGSTGWSWGNPLPQGADLHAVTFDGARGFAVGARGTILRTEDGGATWTGVPSGTETKLTEVAMPDATTVYAGGECVMRRSDDGGVTFRRVAFAARETGCASELAQFAFPTPSLGYVILSDGTVLRTTNGGRSFSQRAKLHLGNSTVPYGNAADAVFPGENTGVVGTGLADPAFFRTTDGAQTWTPVAPAGVGPVRGMHFVTSTLGFAVGSQTPMARTEDGGLTWTPLPVTGVTSSPLSIACASASACVLVSKDPPAGRLFWTADGGLTGTVVDPGPVFLDDAAFASPTRAIAVGEAGATLLSDDAGHTFTRLGGTLPAALKGLRWAGGQTLFGFPSEGLLARSTDGGTSWQTSGAAPLGTIVDVTFVDATTGFLLGRGGGLQRTDDGGASWSVLGPQVDGRSLLATGPQTLFVATDAGILRSVDGGATFERAPGASGPVRRIERGGSGLFAYGTRRLLLSKDGSRWSRVRRPRGGLIVTADFVTAKLGFVVLADGELLTTRDGGRRWRTVWGTGRDDLAQVAFTDAWRGFVTLSDESDLGAVLRTSDGGRTWRPQVLTKSPLGDLVALGPAAAVTLARDSADVFATASGGDAGRPSRLTLRVASKRRLRRGMKVTVTGRLRPAPAGAGVAVTAYVGGSWSRKFARVSAKGRFATTWRLRRGTLFVAQWRGAPGVRSAGTAPLRVRLGRR